MPTETFSGGVANFTEDGTIDTIVVPSTGTYDITAEGATGGATPGNGGGAGAEVAGDVVLTAGDTIEVLVGGMGGPNSSGGGGGGGGSFVYDLTTATLLAVAGGGGGGSWGSGGSGSAGGPGEPGLATTSGGTGGNYVNGFGVSPGGVGGTNGSGGGTGTANGPEGTIDGTVGGGSGGGGGGFDGSGASGHDGGGGTSFLGGGAGGTAGNGGGTVDGFGGFGGGGGAAGNAIGGGGGGGYSGGGAGEGNIGGGGGSFLEAGATNVSLQGGVNSAGNGTVTITETACYVCGTMILTELGEMAVEALEPGDRVAVLLGEGFATVRWVGLRRVDARRHPKPEAVWPVRVLAGAFGDDVPHRDLLLSPDHAVFVAGVLIPIRYLVNGSTVAQVETADVRYYHVELDRHDVLLAEGLAAESYLDTGNRGAFANGGGAIHAHADFAMRVWKTQSCAELVVSGPMVATARARLLARASELGFALTSDPAPRLIVDGRTIHPAIEGAVHRFALPAGAREIVLASRAMAPAWLVADGADPRLLGVAVADLTVDDEAVPPGDARRASGWHHADGRLQWTNGEARITWPGARRVEVTLVPLVSYWNSEAPRAKDAAAA